VFVQLLKRGHSVLRQQEREQGVDPKKRMMPAPEVQEPFIGDKLEQGLRDGEVDLAIHIKEAEKVKLPLKEDQLITCELYYLPNVVHSVQALAYVERRLAAGQSRDLQKRLHLPGVAPGAIAITTIRQPLTTPTISAEEMIAPIIPLILILMTVTGAV